MDNAPRAWWLAVSLLAGLGLVQILDWLPDAWFPYALGVLAGAGMIWAARELRWSRRMQREIQEDLRRMEQL